MAIELCKKCNLPVDTEWPAGFHTCPTEAPPAPAPLPDPRGLGEAIIELHRDLAAVRDDLSGVSMQVGALFGEAQSGLAAALVRVQVAVDVLDNRLRTVERHLWGITDPPEGIDRETWEKHAPAPPIPPVVEP